MRITKYDSKELRRDAVSMVRRRAKENRCCASLVDWGIQIVTDSRLKCDLRQGERCSVVLWATGSCDHNSEQFTVRELIAERTEEKNQ